MMLCPFLDLLRETRKTSRDRFPNNIVTGTSAIQEVQRGLEFIDKKRHFIPVFPRDDR